MAPHVWGGAVGLATACHFIAALPRAPHTDHPPHPQMLEYDMSDNELRTQLLKTPLTLEAGHVLLPEGPGLGIELDPRRRRTLPGLLMAPVKVDPDKVRTFANAASFLRMARQASRQGGRALDQDPQGRIRG